MSEQETSVALPDFAVGAINLASARLGARAIYATDQFFAPLARMRAGAGSRLLRE